VSFGPKLDDLPEVAAQTEIAVKLVFLPTDELDFEQEAFIFVQDIDNSLRTLRLVARCYREGVNHVPSQPEEP
jgi:hypothetical protein